MATTHELFAAAKDGDRDAFDELVHRFHHGLSAFCLGRMGFDLRSVVEVNDILQDVNDILQDTSLKAFQAIGKIQWQGERALGSWFCGIAQNVIYSHSKRLLRIRHNSAEHDTPDLEGTSPSRQVQREERFDRLERALGKLTEEQQQVVRLTRIEGMSVREAALRMARTEKATYQLLWRALQKLREVFGETRSFRLPADRTFGYRDDHV